MLYDPHLDLFLQVAELGSFSKAASVVTRTDNNNDGLAPVLQSLL